MRQHTMLPALLLSIAALLSGPALAQSLPNATVATVPEAPAPDDQITLRLSGQWPDGCIPSAAQTTLARNGSAFRVLVNQAGYSGACTAAVTPWGLDVFVGPLEAGSYTVEVSYTRTLMPAEIIGTGSFEVAPLPESTLWLPGFYAPGGTYSLASTLTAYNNTGHAATVEFLGAWDGLGEYTPPAPVDMPAYASVILDSHSLREGQPVQMLSLRAPRRVAFRATLERLEKVPDGLPKVPESLGRLELPVFNELFPAGMTAVAGDVSLSALECSGGPEARRRVNLTLFNAGSETATFTVSTVSATPVVGTGGGTTKYEVPARSLVQFNALPLESLPVCSPGGAWFRITGDQPFLAYLSTVRPETVPGVLPYEIFPARIDR